MTNSQSDIHPDDLRTIGIVVGAHGLQGTVKIESLSDFPERFEALTVVFLKPPNGPPRTRRVKRIRWAGSSLLLTLYEVTTRDAALDLRGWELCVSEDETWELPDNVYYRSDLLGFAGVAEDGTRLGILINILSGAQDILEFERGEENLLVPFVRQWVGRINLAERTIEILHWRDLIDAETIGTEPYSDDD